MEIKSFEETGPRSATSHAIANELRFARTKFPGTDCLLAALVEEVGELAQALIDHKRGTQTALDVYAEAIQVAAMAIRIAEEGSAEFPYGFADVCPVSLHLAQADRLDKLRTAP